MEKNSMLRNFISAFIFFLSSQAMAVEITCEDPIGNDTAFLISGEMSIGKNDEFSRTVYLISEDGKITVLESTEGKELEQEMIDRLEWSKRGEGYLGTGFVEIDGFNGVGSLYIDQTTEVGTAILLVDGEIVSAMSNYDCKKTG